MALFSFLPYLNIFSRILFFAILCVYLVNLIYKYLGPVVRQGFVDELFSQKQFREDYETCVVEKKKLENDLELQRNMIKKMNKKFREWHTKRLIRQKKDAEERIVNVKKWHMRQEKIATLEEERRLQKKTGYELVQQAKNVLCKKFNGEDGKDSLQTIVGTVLQKDDLVFGNEDRNSRIG